MSSIRSIFCTRRKILSGAARYGVQRLYGHRDHVIRLIGYAFGIRLLDLFMASLRILVETWTGTLVPPIVWQQSTRLRSLVRRASLFANALCKC